MTRACQPISIPPTQAGQRSVRFALLALLVVAATMQAGASGAQTEVQAALAPGSMLSPASFAGAYTPAPAGPPKLSYRLWRLESIYRAQGAAAARAYAQAQRIPMLDGQPRVLIHESPVPLFPEEESIRPGTDAAEEVLFEAIEQAIGPRVQALGGTVRGRTLNMIEATLPLASLDAFTDAAEIAWIEPVPVPHVDLVVSQGVHVVGADQVQQLSSAFHFPPSERVRVGVLDVGFLGYGALMGSELPDDVTTASFHTGGISANGLPAIEQVHGTAVAEIVHDMAPGIEMFFTNADSLFGHSQATSWLLSQQVEVINNSLSWFNVGPGTGEGPINFDVRRATDAGVAWVVSAGNMQQRHWEGAFTDPDGDGWHNFLDDSETNPVQLPAEGSLTLYLNWDDWFSSNQDYDLYIFFECSNDPEATYPCTEDEVAPPSSASLRLEGSSLNPQTGTELPVEQVTVTALADPVVAHVAIRRANASRDVRLEAFYVGRISSTPAFYVPEGSITVPADSDPAVSVGATFWQNDSLEPFSSWGPTADGRTKPDIVAPDGVETVTYGPPGFYGTSAAAPHVAGAIALLKSRMGLFTPDQLVTILYGRALDLGPSGKDNQTGVGRLRVVN